MLRGKDAPAFAIHAYPSLSGASRHCAMVEGEARFEKALRMADLIDAAGIKSQQVAEFQPEHWQQAAAAARVKCPSPATQARVLGILRNRENARDLLRRKPIVTETHAGLHVISCRPRSSGQ